jgi:hypothetical protein
MRRKDAFAPSFFEVCTCSLAASPSPIAAINLIFSAKVRRCGVALLTLVCGMGSERAEEENTRQHDIFFLAALFCLGVTNSRTFSRCLSLRIGSFYDVLFECLDPLEDLVLKTLTFWSKKHQYLESDMEQVYN